MINTGRAGGSKGHWNLEEMTRVWAPRNCHVGDMGTHGFLILPKIRLTEN